MEAPHEEIQVDVEFMSSLQLTYVKATITDTNGRQYKKKHGPGTGILFFLQRQDPWADSIEIVVSFEYTRSTTIAKIPSVSESETDRSNEFQRNQRRLLESGEYSDVQLLVGNTKIKAHRNIVTAHCSYLNAMLRWAESGSNEITITKVEPAVVKMLLEYIYYGGRPAADAYQNGIAIAVFVEAHRWGLENLTKSMESRFCEEMSPNYVVDVLILAETYSRDGLWNYAVAELQRYSDVHMPLPEDKWNKLENSIKVLRKLSPAVITR